MRTLKASVIFRGAGLAIVGLLVWVAPAFAETYSVTPASGDAVDASLGDEVCDDGTGSCTLRAAIQESNTTAASDLITIPAGTFQLTIAPGSPDDATGDLDVTDDVTITGAGIGITVIEQTDADRVLDFGTAADETATLENITVTGGSRPQPAGTSGGGGLLVRNGKVVLQSVRITDNEVTGLQNLSGGGLEVLGGGPTEVDLLDSVVDGNRLVAANVTAPATSGAGIEAGADSGLPSRLTIAGSTVSKNEIVGPTAALAMDARGGGLRVDFSDATIEDSLIEGNTAGEGGGVSVGSDHSLTIRRSTFSDNSATASTGRGGAVMSFAQPLGIEIVNSTFTNNQSGSHGGAIMAFGFNASNSISDSTIAGNNASGEGDGVAAGNGGDVTLTRTVLANGPDDCAVQAGGSLISGGENLEQTEDATGDSCGLMESPGGTDLLDEDPLLGTLTDNSGPTPTMAIGALSPARDATTGCPASAEDQRGFERPDGNAAGAGICDIGAFEFVDLDGDDAEQSADNCPADANPDQADADSDGIGDVCDPTPFPPGPPVAPADTSVSLELSGKKKVKAGKPVKVKATCPEESCEVIARATFKVPKAALSLAAASKKLKTKTLTQSLTGGATETLRLKLKSAAKRKLKSAARIQRFRKKIKVVVKVTATDAAGNTDSGKVKLKLR